MTAFVIAAVAGFGLLIGSFLNVVAYRVPAGMSIVSPPSACPGCGSAIAPRDNVPVVSWLLLRGSCRHCSMRIPVRYPAVEVVTALAFGLAVLPFLPIVGEARPLPLLAGGLELVAFLYLAAISVALAVIDLDTWRLPDVIVIPAYAVGAVLLGSADLIRGDLGAAGTAAAGAGASVLFYLVLVLARPGGMGYGDVKLAGVLGLFLGHLGLPQLAVGVGAAFVLGGLYGVGLIAARRAGRSSAVPFGPWMLGGAWIGVLAGEPIATAYLAFWGLA